ncbi:G-protein coupled receptor Mth2 isoform X2 [Ptiloglossa arizonensis]
MSGNTERLLMLLQILVCKLAISNALVNNGTSTIHVIPLQNKTEIPGEYKDLPVVGKCCPKGEVFVKNQTRNAVCTPYDSTIDENFTPLFCDFNKSGVVVPGEQRDAFVAIVGEPCKYKRYILDPEENKEDENYLLLNGSVFAPSHVPSMLTHGVDYCMEIVPGVGLKTFVCFDEEDKIVIASSRVIIYATGLLISVPFLILTIVAYSITPKLQDLLGRTLCHYCGCLALAFTALSIMQLGSSHFSSQACTSIAFVIQFSFIACFFWLNAMCIEMWSVIRSHVDRETYKRMKPRTLFFWYSLWCWGPSLILILVSMIMDVGPTIPATYVKLNFAEDCWSKSDNNSMPFFYVPVGLLLLGNIALFVLTFVNLSKYQKDLDLRFLAGNPESDGRDRCSLRRLMRTVLVCLIVFFLMGLNWTMELIFWFVNGDPTSWTTFDVVNALQGVLVFGLFVLRRPQRYYVWLRIQQLRGVNAVTPEIGSMDLCLLPILSGDRQSSQTIIP